MLIGLFKNASFGPVLNLHRGIFYLWESFDSDSAWVRESPHIEFLSSPKFSRV